MELTARVRSLDSTIGRLARANREFQAYAGTVKSESAAEERTRITRELHDTVGYTLTTSSSGMRERLAELGGTISAHNVADGFQLAGTIPYAMGEIIGSDQGSDSG